MGDPPGLNRPGQKPAKAQQGPAGVGRMVVEDTRWCWPGLGLAQGWSGDSVLTGSVSCGVMGERRSLS